MPILSPTLFSQLINVMLAMAAVVFVSLYFVNAGYGQFRTKHWGWSIDNRVAWVLMEAPVFCVMLAIWMQTGHPLHVPELVLFAMFQLHYFQRSFIFPWLMHGHSRMPVAIVAMGALFNTINGILQGGALFWYPNPDYAEGASYLTSFQSVAGLALFAAGMAINLHSDHVIRHLRQPGDTRHYLPSRGYYRLVTSANYFGELVEWIGFAAVADTLAAWVFPIWTAANLVPRAHAIYNKYRTEFGAAALAGRKRIIPFIY
ncbi:MAG: 3-oxo-5-alpha-steroid 4-dehydrogenase [Bacteroidaceae bacterium]|nr:3-oxo-5-alpha-steroid 4-dehydrogenase [Bacteroidaceae bacterium]